LAILFIDTTYKTCLGLLDKDLNWIEFRAYENQRASGLLQSETYSICAKYGIPTKALEGIITVSGPGFYTGLRVSEGFSDIFQLFNIPNYSFYSFDIPKLLGHSQGTWITKAYRGEYFIHSWNGDHSSNDLIQSSLIQQRIEQSEKKFIHCSSALDIETDAMKTLDLIQHVPQKIFSLVLEQKLKKEIFYFRAPEDEFRMNP
jgi:tRNA threonylcarbamoyladenosine biosynthesis protein TsaB